MQASHRYRVNGIDLAVTVEGEGPDVLLVHGFPDSGDVWRHQVPALVAAGYRVIVPDMRGCGLSDAPAGKRHYRLWTLVADLVALLDQLGVAKVRLIAHDWGAVIGWQLCIRHPERVDRYIALSVGHPGAYASGGFEQKRKGWYVFFLQLRGVAELALRCNRWWALRALSGFHDEAPRWIASLSRPGRLTAAINYYRANWRLVFARRWPRVRVPVCGVWSSGDRFLTEGQMSRSHAWVDAPWRYERIEGVDHWMQLSAPGRVNDILLDCLRAEHPHANARGVDAAARRAA